MQVIVNIDDAIWTEYLKIDEKKERIEKITEEAVRSYVKRMKVYHNLLQMEGKAKWEGNLDELRENRI